MMGSTCNREDLSALHPSGLQTSYALLPPPLLLSSAQVVPFTPSAGVIEWVDGTVPLGDYLLGSTRNGGAHARYGADDWSFLKCREVLSTVSLEWSGSRVV